VWDFGDGTTAAGVEVTHTFQHAGDFAVALRVTDQQRVTASATQTITVRRHCHVALPVAFQQGLPPHGDHTPPWEDDIYAFTKTQTIARKGCALTALAMALAFAGTTTLAGPSPGPLDPGTLNAFMVTNRGYTPQSRVKWEPTVKRLNPRLQFDHFMGVKSSRADPAGAYQTLDHFLCAEAPHPVIVGVRGLSRPGTFPGHFVLVTGKQERPDGTFPPQYFIEDPEGHGTSLDDYPGFGALPEFVTRGAVRAHGPSHQRPLSGAVSDQSSLSVYANETVALVVTDPVGRRTGVDPRTGQSLQDIPHSAHGMDAIEDDLPGESALHLSHFIEISPLPQGLYLVSLRGQKPGAYTVEIEPFSQDGSAQPPLTLQGMATPGVTATFQLRFLAAPGAASHLVSIPGDRDQAGEVDHAERHLLLVARNNPGSQSACGAPCDVDGDGTSTAFDTRPGAWLCPQPRCATAPGILGLQAEVAVFLRE
jgi:hypothetical protein